MAFLGRSGRRRPKSIADNPFSIKALPCKSMKVEIVSGGSDQERSDHRAAFARSPSCKCLICKNRNAHVASAACIHTASRDCEMKSHVGAGRRAGGVHAWKRPQNKQSNRALMQWLGRKMVETRLLSLRSRPVPQYRTRIEREREGERERFVKRATGWSRAIIRFSINLQFYIAVAVLHRNSYERQHGTRNFDAVVVYRS